MDGLLFRMNQIIIPRSLQKQVIKAAHHLGHLGTTKTKQMIRGKYWFPTMNSMIEQIIGQCYECQVTTKQHRQEPIKVTDIPKKPWDVIAVDFSGPYPDGHYNLVAIDKRTRYPEVAKTHSTAFQPTKEKLKTMFATLAPQDSWKVTTDHRLIPESLQSSLKQKDFTIIESPQNMHVLMARRKAS